jgi:hypothetical protein
MAGIMSITVVLAGFDLAGAVFAKEWDQKRHPWLLAAGVLMSIGLFAVFAISMQYAEMSTVTLGWIVVLQVGLMLTEQIHYHIDHGLDRWAAVLAMIALQGYLLATSTTEA